MLWYFIADGNRCMMTIGPPLAPATSSADWLAGRRAMDRLVGASTVTSYPSLRLWEEPSSQVLMAQYAITLSPAADSPRSRLGRGVGFASLADSAALVSIPTKLRRRVMAWYPTWEFIFPDGSVHEWVITPIWLDSPDNSSVKDYPLRRN